MNPVLICHLSRVCLRAFENKTVQPANKPKHISEELLVEFQSILTLAALDLVNWSDENEGHLHKIST